VDQKPSPVRIPLHSDVSLLAQRGRELLRETGDIEQEIAAILLDAIWISSLLPARSRCAPLAAGIPHRIRNSNLSDRRWLC
jgi:hypothetical protein